MIIWETGVNGDQEYQLDASYPGGSPDAWSLSHCWEAGQELVQELTTWRGWQTTYPLTVRSAHSWGWLGDSGRQPVPGCHTLLALAELGFFHLPMGEAGALGLQPSQHQEHPTDTLGLADREAGCWTEVPTARSWAGVAS